MFLKIPIISHLYAGATGILVFDNISANTYLINLKVPIATSAFVSYADGATLLNLFHSGNATVTLNSLLVRNPYHSILTLGIRVQILF